MSTRVERAVESGDAFDEASVWLTFDVDVGDWSENDLQMLVAEAARLDLVAMATEAKELVADNEMSSATREMVTLRFLESSHGQSWLDDYERPEDAA